MLIVKETTLRNNSVKTLLINGIYITEVMSKYGETLKKRQSYDKFTMEKVHTEFVEKAKYL